MRHHINTVVRTVVHSFFFHLRRLKSVQPILGAEVTSGLVSAFVTTRLDYCNSVLAGLLQSTIDPLQRVQNAAARHVAGTGTRDHITPVLQSIHWLPIKFRTACLKALRAHASGASWSQSCVHVGHNERRRVYKLATTAIWRMKFN